MRKNKITQKQAIFYLLLKSRKENPLHFIPVFRFMGEVFVEELGKWGFVSHECSARASELAKENPNLIESTKISGKSGAKYYAYRFRETANASCIEDPALREFYRNIKRVSAPPVDNSACVAN